MDSIRKVMNMCVNIATERSLQPARRGCGWFFFSNRKPTTSYCLTTHRPNCNRFVWSTALASSPPTPSPSSSSTTPPKSTSYLIIIVIMKISIIITSRRLGWQQNCTISRRTGVGNSPFIVMRIGCHVERGTLFHRD